jgi:hypothetical protein
MLVKTSAPVQDIGVRKVKAAAVQEESEYLPEQLNDGRILESWGSSRRTSKVALKAV